MSILCHILYNSPNISSHMTLHNLGSRNSVIKNPVSRYSVIKNL